MPRAGAARRVFGASGDPPQGDADGSTLAPQPIETNRFEIGNGALTENE
jgi:hypothetical protein